MIIHKRFQKNYDKGGIEVQLNFNDENKETKVSYIHIKSSFDCGLPTTPTLEKHESKPFLVAHYTDEYGRKVSNRIIDNSYADDIVNEILELERTL